MRTNTEFIPRVIAAVAAFAISATLLSGCAESDLSEGIELGDNTTSITEDEMRSQTIPSADLLPEGSNAFGVVTAALLISAGDLDKALLEGQVTPSEVKYAMLAIKDGTLDLWRNIAETEAAE